MQEEIFGPILPIVAVKDVDAAIAYVNAASPAAGAVPLRPRCRAHAARARRLRAAVSA